MDDNQRPLRGRPSNHPEANQDDPSKMSDTQRNTDRAPLPRLSTTTEYFRFLDAPSLPRILPRPIIQSPVPKRALGQNSEGLAWPRTAPLQAPRALVGPVHMDSYFQPFQPTDPDEQLKGLNETCRTLPAGQDPLTDFLISYDKWLAEAVKRGKGLQSFPLLYQERGKGRPVQFRNQNPLSGNCSRFHRANQRHRAT